MSLLIHTRLAYRFDAATDILLQIEAAAIPEQGIEHAHLDLPLCEHFARVPAEDSIGDRLWLRYRGDLQIDYRSRVAIARTTPDLAGLGQMPLHRLPGETVAYLFDSRYCPAQQFQTYVEDEFGEQRGGARVLALCDWIRSRFRYEPGSSDSDTTALDTFVQRRGVCRDYAHVLVTLVRASGIPARMASVYAPDVDPPDFHAVAEVFLADPDGEGGAWHLVDATGMARAGDMAKIGIGRDAADISFLTSFGPARMLMQEIAVSRV